MSYQTLPLLLQHKIMETIFKSQVSFQGSLNACLIVYIEDSEIMSHCDDVITQIGLQTSTDTVSWDLGLLTESPVLCSLSNQCKKYTGKSTNRWKINYFFNWGGSSHMLHMFSVGQPELVTQDNIGREMRGNSMCFIVLLRIGTLLAITL